MILQEVKVPLDTLKIRTVTMQNLLENGAYKEIRPILDWELERRNLTDPIQIKQLKKSFLLLIIVSNSEVLKDLFFWLLRQGMYNLSDILPNYDQLNIFGNLKRYQYRIFSKFSMRQNLLDFLENHFQR